MSASKIEAARKLGSQLGAKCVRGQWPTAADDERFDVAIGSENVAAYNAFQDAFERSAKLTRGAR